MSDPAYYDVSYEKRVPEQDGVTRLYWIKIGRAFPGKDGKISIRLDAMPLPGWDGSLVLFPKEKE